ncbi:hypothetical protein BH23CHL3_BH23CHL3_03850 [soil metagenome]
MDAPHQPDRRRVVVIGPCASGKTTLTQRLRALGFDARVCGQEHSEILELWKHMQPDVLIGLWIDLETLRDRRSSASWAGSIYARQQHRLASGYAHADLVIDCHDIDPDEVERDVLEWLREHPVGNI